MAVILRTYLITDISQLKEGDIILLSNDGGINGKQYGVLEINNPNLMLLPIVELRENESTIPILPPLKTKKNFMEIQSSCYKYYQDGSTSV